MKTRFVQISDCHLYADKNTRHHGVNVFDNLRNVLKKIKQLTDIDFIIFTGDLTQDHSDASYQNFVEALELEKITLPLYFLAGNHDDPQLFSQFFIAPPFNDANIIETLSWQILLVDSKSDTPSGYVSIAECERLLSLVDNKKNQIIFMHHHIKDVGYFIDKHGLKNQQDFYATLSEIKNLKALACGHVHNSLALSVTIMDKNIPFFTCPATSIQFAKTTKLDNSGKPAGFRLFDLYDDGAVESQSIFL
ncbi:metallophosphoesterase [Colwelliaceae bacterium 6441]